MSNERKNEKNNEKIAMRVSVNTIIGNAVLSGVKLIAGIFGHSTAMLADAAHSLSDVLSTVVVMISVKLAAKKADKDHPYGHERFECVGAIILSLVLLATGAGIGWEGVSQIMENGFAGDADAALPGLVALIAAVVSLAAKEVMYRYTRAAAKKINSGVLMADAWHHRTDALSSVGSFIGILGARLFGLASLDAVAAIAICLFIAKAAFDVFREAIGKMTDKACDDKTDAQIREVILAQKNVLAVDELKTRIFGDRIYVDVEISVCEKNTLQVAHEIAHTVHDAIEEEFKQVKHCSVHVNPKISD